MNRSEGLRKQKRERVKEKRKRESLEAAVDLNGLQDPSCQRRAILNHVDNPSSLTRVFSSSTSCCVSAERVCVCVSVAAVALSVPVC